MLEGLCKPSVVHNLTSANRKFSKISFPMHYYRRQAEDAVGKPPEGFGEN